MAGRRKLDNVKIRASLNVKCTHCDEERHLPKGEIELVKPNRIIVHADGHDDARHHCQEPQPLEAADVAGSPFLFLEALEHG